METRKLKPEVAMYLRRIGDMRSVQKHGRAVQLCDRALEHGPDPRLINVILNFKADSLYRVGRRIREEFLIDMARQCYGQILEADPEDYMAQKGLERINFEYY